MLWARLTNLRPAQVHTPCLQQIRWISEEQLNASQDHPDDLFHRTLQNASRKKSDRPILTTRREALALYREVLRYSNLFVWKDNQGRVWRDVIRTSTRKVGHVTCIAACGEPAPCMHACWGLHAAIQLS